MNAISRLSAGLILLALALPMPAQERHWDQDILKETFGFGPGTPSDVPWDSVFQGCPARDCIPAIDAPRFVPAAAAGFLTDEDLVIGLTLAGRARAYPTRILNYHEIVNDTLAHRAVAVTWCPLCGSGLVFAREIDGKPVEFGVSGLLHNSDLVMYDRASQSLWQQITGTAFAGPLRGRELTALPSSMTTWRQWRGAHPDTQVLAPPSDEERYRDPKPYGDYERSDRLLFPVAQRSPSLRPKEVVYGVETAAGPIAVTERALRKQGQLQVELRGGATTWRRDENGEVEVRGAGGEVLLARRMFWFAWYSFHPGTALHDREP